MDKSSAANMIVFFDTLSQKFAKPLSGWRHIPTPGTRDADRDHFLYSGHWSISQSLPAHNFENRKSQGNAPARFDRGDQGTGTVAFQHDARLESRRAKEALNERVILRIISA